MAETIPERIARITRDEEIAIEAALSATMFEPVGVIAARVPMAVGRAGAALSRLMKAGRVEAEGRTIRSYLRFWYRRRELRRVVVEGGAVVYTDDRPLIED